MRHVTLGLLIGSLILGGLVLPAEARGWRHGYHGHHQSHHGHYGHHHRRHHGHFAGGFLAGAATFLAVDALRTPRVVYTSPVVYQPAYYQAPVCRDVWVPGRQELHPRHQNGFTTYYHVWVDGHWQRQC